MPAIPFRDERPAVAPSQGPAASLRVVGREGVLLHVGDVLGDLVEGGVAVDLVAAGGEHRVLLVGAGRGDVGGLDHPDAHALVAPGVQVAGGVHGHLVVGRVQRADVHVVEPALAPDEHLVQRPVAARRGRLYGDGHVGPGGDGAVPALGGDVAHQALTAWCLAAYAVAASVTQALSSR